MLFNICQITRKCSLNWLKTCEGAASVMPNQEVPKFMQFLSKRSWLLSIYTCQSGGPALVSHVAEILSHVHDNLFIATSTHSMHAVHPLCILCLMPLVVKAIRISTSNIETSAWKRGEKNQLASVLIQMLWPFSRAQMCWLIYSWGALSAATVWIDTFMHSVVGVKKSVPVFHWRGRGVY